MTDGLCSWLSERQSPAGSRRGGNVNELVKKNKRIITKLKVEMKVRGEMSYAECMAYVQAISKYGLTTGQLNNILAQHFNRVKDIRTISILGSSNIGSVWSVRP
jgi:hypothetical protein